VVTGAALDRDRAGTGRRGREVMEEDLHAVDGRTVARAQCLADEVLDRDVEGELLRARIVAHVARGQPHEDVLSTENQRGGDGMATARLRSGTINHAGCNDGLADHGRVDHARVRIDRTEAQWPGPSAQVANRVQRPSARNRPDQRSFMGAFLRRTETSLVRYGRDGAG